jgi:hypothetical protein
MLELPLRLLSAGVGDIADLSNGRRQRPRENPQRTLTPVDSALSA